MNKESSDMPPVGVPLEFFGVDGERFKLGDKVYCAVEDEGDGYRSYLGTVEVVPEPSDVFFRAPLDVVEVREVTEPSDYDGWALVSADGHEWLRFGTGNADDYYPYFDFRYTPRGPQP